ncbi:antitoxin Xre/MbcA/ParS toxin-binding domain-containing protein [Roseateles toxinivorans]|uniref:antitoxin Xre/MbcA/ParS toxin-binding domain-containing protein n=1 Tax=Roseateles toxinivorans TaxID=270368 RepID=UPI0014152247|nr:antitoxin Xre/MbcA/ParS toxin-binding domain-containing protein [Roseateles toxinivorans]
MDRNAVIRTFITAQRSALDRLESFAGTPTYERLLAILWTFADGDPEPWLAAWLIEPNESLGDRPLDVVGRPGGLELLIAHLERMASGVCA